jgi:predicted Zn-dependent protease
MPIVKGCVSTVISQFSTNEWKQGMTRWLVTLLLAAPGCAGAQQLLDFRDDLAFQAEVVEAVAERAYRERIQRLEADGKLDRDREFLERVRRASARLRPVAKRERPTSEALSWEIHLCRECDENASAVAGGKLLLGEEFILGLALSDEELGYLVAHEMAHVLAEHTREFATSARYFMDNGLNRDYEDVQSELEESIGVQLRMAFLCSQQELDADYIGFILGAEAGYEPHAMPSLLHKLRSEQGALVASHPSIDRRAFQAGQMLDAALLVWQRAMSAS